MQKLKVLIEENAFGSVRLMEVSATASISTLVPSLVAELKLPQTDLFGKQLVYVLCEAVGGRILPEKGTLLAAGVKPGTRLAPRHRKAHPSLSRSGGTLDIVSAPADRATHRDYSRRRDWRHDARSY